jgi:hypothetical protein
MMIIGDVTLTGGAGARIGEATRADGVTTIGGGKSLEGTMVTITGVRGVMTTCGVSTMVAGGTTPDGEMVTKPGGAANIGGVTTPGCTGPPKPPLKIKALRAGAFVANSRTTVNPTARISPFRMSHFFMESQHLKAHIRSCREKRRHGTGIFPSAG